MSPERLDRGPFRLDFADRFDAAELDDSLWLPHYLPHWTTPDRSAARYRTGAAGLELRIDADQLPWRPEDGALRVSNLQTGSFSGPVGSPVGQHRHRTDLVVRTAQPTRRLWAPSSGLVEATMAATTDPTCMLALWLVGLEEGSPEQSGEICVAELFGNAIGPHGSSVRSGVKAHHDPRLRTEMSDLPLDIDASEQHAYAAEWDAHRTRFYVDDALVLAVEQGFDYPLQLMVDLFELPGRGERPPADYPKRALVRQVRGHTRRASQVPGVPER